MHQPEHREAVVARIKELANGRGRLSADVVIADARNPESVLHAEFEWDLEKAAHESWVERARALIKLVKFEVVIHSETVAVPYYVRDPDADAGEQGYVAVPIILSEPQRAIRALKAEIQRALDSLHRAEAYTAVLDEYNVELGVALRAVERVLRTMEAAPARKPPPPRKSGKKKRRLEKAGAR
jgi:hypothetical protein